MAQVPYNPDPEVTPTSQGAPKVNVDTPFAAFGGTVAQAVSSLGQTVTGASNEIFGRAVAFQQLNNESEARDADAQYMIQAGKIHADFNALPPGQRAGSYDGYVKNLEDLRQKVRGNISNPMAQKMFDSSSLSTMGRTIFNGAGVAASGTREFNNKTLSDSLDLDVQAINDNPTDDGLFADKLARIKQNAIKLSAGTQGADENSPITQDLIQKAQSKAILARVNGLAKVNKVEDAQRFYDNNRGLMREDDAAKAAGTVEAKTIAVTSKSIADDVFTQMGDKATLKDMEAEAEKRMKAKTDDPLAVKAAVSAVQSRSYIARNAERQEQQQNSQDVSTIIVNNKPKDLSDFLTQPGGQDVYNKMTPKQQQALPGDIARYHQKVDAFDNAVEFNRIKGMQYSEDGKAELLGLDPYKLDLSQSQIGQVIAMRGKLIEKGQADPHVGAFFNQLKRTNGSELEALGIYNRASNKEEFDHFQGEIADAVHEWLETKKSMPTAADFQDKIAPTLLKQIQQPGRFWGTNTQRQFQVPVPDNEHEQIIMTFKQAGRPEPNEEEISRFYHRKLYRSAFESMKADRAPTQP